MVTWQDFWRENVILRNFGFRAVVSLLKKLGNLLEHSGKGTASPTTMSMVTEITQGKFGSVILIPVIKPE